MIALAIMMGSAFIRIPYHSHKHTPTLKIRNIPKELSAADFERHVLITWGMNAIVVSVPAAVPNAVVGSIIMNIAVVNLLKPDFST